MEFEFQEAGRQLGGRALSDWRDKRRRWFDLEPVDINIVEESGFYPGAVDGFFEELELLSGSLFERPVPEFGAGTEFGAEAVGIDITVIGFVVGFKSAGLEGQGFVLPSDFERLEGFAEEFFMA